MANHAIGTFTDETSKQSSTHQSRKDVRHFIESTERRSI
jgi:hypothetical protein